MVSMAGAQMQKFAGNYSAGALGAITVRVEGDHLLVSNQRTGSFPLFPSGDATFFSMGVTPDVKFSVDDRGRVIGFTSGNVKATKLPE